LVNSVPGNSEPNMEPIFSGSVNSVRFSVNSVRYSVLAISCPGLAPSHAVVRCLLLAARCPLLHCAAATRCPRARGVLPSRSHRRLTLMALRSRGPRNACLPRVHVVGCGGRARHLRLAWGCLVSKNFHPKVSHRILWYIHGVLNVDETNYTVWLKITRRIF
jgi:hypothetical protein